MAFDLTALNLGLGLASKHTSARLKEERDRNMKVIKALADQQREEYKYQRRRRDVLADLDRREQRADSKFQAEKLLKNWDDTGKELRSWYKTFSTDARVKDDPRIGQLFKGLNDQFEAAKKEGKAVDLQYGELGSQIGKLRSEAKIKEAEAKAGVAKTKASESFAKEERGAARSELQGYWRRKKSDWNKLGNRIGQYEAMKADPALRSSITPEMTARYELNLKEYEVLGKELEGENRRIEKKHGIGKKKVPGF